MQIRSGAARSSAAGGGGGASPDSTTARSRAASPASSAAPTRSAPRDARRAAAGGRAPPASAGTSAGTAIVACPLPLDRRPGTYSSSTAWKLVPPKPNALTPATAGVAVRHLPVAQLGVDRERRRRPVDVRVRRREAEARRQRLVVERERRLEHPGRAGRGLEVADVRLHGAERDRAGRQAGAGERLAQAGQLDEVADRASTSRGPRSASTPPATGPRCARRARSPASGRSGSAR